MNARLFLFAVVCTLPITISAQNKPYMQDLPYYVENLNMYGEGQEEGRAFHLPEGSVSLNGTWKFLYCESPYDVPQDFFKTTFNDRKWSNIEVPSNWEMQGFGQAAFRNTAALWPTNRPASSMPANMTRRFPPQEPNPYAVTPPEVRMDQNPTGAYRTSFNIPSSWKGEQVFLRFEKVASASFVWVNGQQVGYNEGAQEPSEYNITK